MYKVVRKQRGRLYSVTMVQCLRSSNWDQAKKWRVRYIPDEWVKAEIGGLFIFNNLSDAIRFVSEFLTTRFIHEVEIWRCKTKETKKMSRMLVSYSVNFLTFWTKPCSSNLLITSPPPGTFTAREVMLTKRVRTWDEISQEMQKELKEAIQCIK